MIRIKIKMFKLSLSAFIPNRLKFKTKQTKLKEYVFFWNLKPKLFNELEMTGKKTHILFIFST